MVVGVAVDNGGGREVSGPRLVVASKATAVPCAGCIGGNDLTA